MPLDKIEIKKFRDLSNDEIFAIYKLRIDVFVVEQDCPYPDVDDIDKTAEHIFIMAGEVACCYLRLYTQDDVIKIGRVVTDINYRSKGLAARLIRFTLNHIENHYKEQRIAISAQSHLMHYYQGFGFEKYTDEYLEDGIPHVGMIIHR